MNNTEKSSFLTTNGCCRSKKKKNHSEAADFTKTESCKLKAFPITSSTNNKADDIIFKKPLPVTKKCCTSPPKPLKIEKVVSLGKKSFLLKRRNSIKIDSAAELNLQENAEKLTKMHLINGKTVSATSENKINSGTLEKNSINDNDVVDELSQLSKLLTDEINSLTCNANIFEDKIKINNKPKEIDIRRDLAVKRASEEIKDLKINNTKDDEKQNELLNTNMEEIKNSSLYDNRTLSNLILKSDSQISKNILNSKLNAFKENVSALNNSKEKLANETIEGNKTTTDVAFKIKYQKNLQSNEIKENKSVNDEPITSTDVDIANKTENEVSASERKPISKMDGKIVVEKSEREKKNEVDFEFENKCLTPTMCRIDLDVISENTADVTNAITPTISMSECEADKLFEDFNHKTEDIVGCTSSKKKIPCDMSIIENSNECSSEIQKGCKAEILTSKNILSRDKNELNNDNICYKNNIKLKKVSDAKELCNDKLKTKRKSEQRNKNKISSRENKKLKFFNGPNKNENLHKNVEISKNEKEHQPKPLKTPSDLDTYSQTCNENTQETINAETAKSAHDIDENTQLSFAKLDQSSKDHMKSQHSETFVSENQHMNAESVKRQEVMDDECKTNDSEDGDVSAIFSFPTIPVISISIHTSPNNKTYFKISNRENDGKKKDGGKAKKIKSPQPEDDKTKVNEEEEPIKASNSNKFIETVSDSEIKEVKSSQTCSEEELDQEEEKESVIRTETINMENEKHADEGDDDDTEKYEEEEVGGDNEDNEIEDIDLEKYSHDSNSACSLPLKKRPTQSDPNGDTADDSQITDIASYDQPEEIAAEVIIENTCKNKAVLNDNALVQLQQETIQTAKQGEERNKIFTSMSSNIVDDIDDNKASTGSICLKNVPDASSSFKRCLHTPLRASGQAPIQIVVPQIKENSVSPNHDNRIMDSQNSNASRMSIQCFQPLPESYPATPMLSVANVEKLMDFNRFIEDLLDSPDVITIINNANACGYYAEGHTYELERIAILEHYNIANAKVGSTVTKPLYWKKSAGDTISIFNDNDNEWISLPPSTAKQLQKLSFVLSILQQQYKVSDVRQRINIALAFLIRNTSKFKNTSTPNSIQQRMQLYFRNISDINSSNHNNSQPLRSPSYFRVATNNESLNTHFNINSAMENSQEFPSTNISNSQQQPDHILQQESTINLTSSLNSPQRFNSNNIESEQSTHAQTSDKRTSSWDDINTDQLYINPPCATSPQNEVIVNTNGVELLEIPQDSQNILISITDESGPSSTESSTHKYNTRQQPQFRAAEDRETASCSFHTQQSYGKRSCLPNNGSSFLSNQFLRHNIIPTFGNHEINLQNPYRVQQQHNVNESSNSNFSRHTISQQKSSTLSQHHQSVQQRNSSRSSSLFNTQLSVNSQQSQSKDNESNFKAILQPYITYLIKDHEKTSKHLLQVFEEVSNSNSISNVSVINNINRRHQQQFSNLLPPLIRNPQQNHMPGFHQPTNIGESILPSLIRNPHQSSLITRDSGALQVVQSFIDQSQATFNAAQQKTDQQLQLQQQMELSPSIGIPGFASEYVNFVGIREKLRTGNEIQEEVENSNPPEMQLNKKLMQQQHEPQRLNSLKRKCQERNNTKSEYLKRKIEEFSLLQHNVRVKLLEKEQDKIKNIPMVTRRRGRPKKITSKMSIENNNETILSGNKCGFSTKDNLPNKCTTRATRRKQTKSDLETTASTIDHAYFRQRTAAREAAKRINAAINSSFN